MIIPNWPVENNIKSLCITKQDTQLPELPNKPFYLNQIHGNKIVNLDNSSVDNTADASFTKMKNKICVIRTADCLPILIYDPIDKQVAAVHAGWRGCLNGVIENSLEKFTKKSELLIWLGPAISQKNYEVGHEVYDGFIDKNNNFKHNFIAKKNNKYLLDLYGIAKDILKNNNIKNIYGAEYCTFDRNKLFYSYRKNKDVGRNLTMIWME